MFRASSGIAQFATPFYDPSWGGEKIPLAREQRRLAAIVAADVVGYSRLMGRDESGTLARLREHRKQRFEPTLARHGGRLVKLTGDGALAEFPSAVDALSAAIEFQQAMADVNAVLNLIHRDDAAALNESIGMSALHNKPWAMDFRILHKTSRAIRWVHGESQPRRLPDGAVLWNG